MMWKRRFSRRRRMTREDKAREEMAWRKINEDIELEREGVEPLLDSYFVYSTEVGHIPSLFDGIPLIVASMKIGSR